jgi:ankyrin repeat protein
MKKLNQESPPKQKHLVMALFDTYQDGALSEEERSACDQHLRHCPACQAWVANQAGLERQLRSEALPMAKLTPAAAARIRKNLFSKMRRALIMNNVRNMTGAAVAAAVLIVVVGLFIWQSRMLNTQGLVDQVASQVQTTTGEAVPEEAVPETVSEAADVAPAELVSAVVENDLASLQQLLADGLDPNLPDEEGNALLALAAREGQLEAAQLLLENGADINGTVSVGSPPYPGENETALSEAAKNNHPELVELLLENGADPNIVDTKIGLAPINWAAGMDYADIVSSLIEHGADINATTPIINAVEQDAPQALQALIEGGVDVNATEEDMAQPPLIVLLIRVNSPQSVEKIGAMLLDAGANPDLQDSLGNTALHYAARLNKAELIPLLIEHKAALDIENNNGQTPLDMAANDEIKEMFIEAGANQ